MSDNARVGLLFAANLLLYLIIGELNNLVSGVSIYLHLDALIIVFFGLFLNRKSSLLFTVLLGLLADAVYPAPAGTYFVGYLGIWVFFNWCQRRIRRQNKGHVRFVTMLAEVGWIVLLTLFLGREQLLHWVYWQRILLDILFSLFILYVATWPWCQFQKKLLFNLGWDIEAQVTRV